MTSAFIFAASPFFGQSQKNKTYRVAPVNILDDTNNNLAFDNETSKGTYDLIPFSDSLDIQLIRLKDCHKDSILSRMNKLGFHPVPINYLIGFAVQYPERLWRIKWITTIDTASSVWKDQKRFMYINLRKRNYGVNPFGLGPQSWWEYDWWFMVQRKT